MNAIFMLMIGLSFAAAQRERDVETVERSIRDHYATQGEVLRVEMRKNGADQMRGFITLRDQDGIRGRANCVARLDGAEFVWNCRPDITDDMVRNIEATIRAALAAQGEVLSVDLARRDDMRMVGRARLRTAAGDVVRTNCTATRENPDSRIFNWECRAE